MQKNDAKKLVIYSFSDICNREIFTVFRSCSLDYINIFKSSFFPFEFELRNKIFKRKLLRKASSFVHTRVYCLIKFNCEKRTSNTAFQPNISAVYDNTINQSVLISKFFCIFCAIFINY